MPQTSVAMTQVLVPGDCQLLPANKSLYQYHANYLCHPFSGYEIPSSVHVFPPRKTASLITKMSNLLTICVTVLCLQAKANIVSNKGKKGLWTMSACFCRYPVFFPLKDSLNLCKWHCHPLKYANVLLAVCYETSALQRVECSFIAI